MGVHGAGAAAAAAAPAPAAPAAPAATDASDGLPSDEVGISYSVVLPSRTPNRESRVAGPRRSAAPGSGPCITRPSMSVGGDMLAHARSAPAGTAPGWTPIARRANAGSGSAAPRTSWTDGLWSDLRARRVRPVPWREGSAAGRLSQDGPKCLAKGLRQKRTTCNTFRSLSRPCRRSRGVARRRDPAPGKSRSIKHQKGRRRPGVG